MNYFEENYDKVQFARKTEECNGLRNAQIGASHAIASFFTLKPNSTAIVVMPTGSGKTAVLNITPFLVCARKVLVITPSKMVRSQIFEEFSELNTLINTNVLPALIHKPNVLEMEHRYIEDEKKKYDNFDVVVATPQCALSLVEDREEAEKFDCILIDEAHHTPAASWTKIIELTDKAKHVLFTATPFRIDYQEIKGEMVYRYPLNLAYQDGIFGEILYIPIEESDNKDLKIAIKAEEVFNEDRAKGLEHYLMVRTATKDKAKELETLYKENTSLRLQRIDSSMTNSTVKSCIKLLRERKLDGIICVDMLGEGFDFPNLKIAAIHEVHKSLANTLQFIGRFARTNASNIGTAKFIAINDEEKPLCNLTDCTLLIKENSANKIKISMSVDDIEKILICDVDGHYCSADETKKITVYIHGERVLLEEYFSTYPLQFKATDDTVVQGDEILPGSKSVTAYNSNGIIEIDWENEYHTDISIEFNDKKHHPTGKSIQTSLREILEEDKENQYIIYDHGSGEMADYITAKINNNVITITLYHVKKKHGEYNGDVNDIYEVTSQAIKSIIWFKNKGSLIDKITSRRKSNHAKFIKGDYKTFCKDVRDANYYMSGRIAIVQPAISKSRPLPDKFQEILGATKHYVESSGKISELLVLGSL